jgi:hypothetical protein
MYSYFIHMNIHLRFGWTQVGHPTPGEGWRLTPAGGHSADQATNQVAADSAHFLLLKTAGLFVLRQLSYLPPAACLPVLQQLVFLSSSSLSSCPQAARLPVLQQLVFLSSSSLSSCPSAARLPVRTAARHPVLQLLGFLSSNY